jgi:hypothetical protein
MTRPIRAMAVVLWVMLVSSANAIEYKDVQGKWCGTASDYIFERELLIVIMRDKSPNKKFKIDKCYWKSDSFTVNWLGAQNQMLHTDFAEFGADKKSMTQLSNENGPPRPFKRC